MPYHEIQTFDLYINTDKSYELAVKPSSEHVLAVKTKQEFNLEG